VKIYAGNQVISLGDTQSPIDFRIRVTRHTQVSKPFRRRASKARDRKGITTTVTFVVAELARSVHAAGFSMVNKSSLIPESTNPRTLFKFVLEGSGLTLERWMWGVLEECESWSKGVSIYTAYRIIGEEMLATQPTQ
jgi:hypothetical protein